MTSEIAIDSIIAIKYSPKTPGKYKWYAPREPEYKRRFFGLWREKIRERRIAGWYTSPDDPSFFATSTQDLISYGYEVVEMPTGDFVCYKLPTCTIEYGLGSQVDKKFQTDDEMLSFIREVEHETGKKFITI